MRTRLLILSSILVMSFFHTPFLAARQLDCLLHFSEPFTIDGFSSGVHGLYEYVDTSGSKQTCGFDGEKGQEITFSVRGGATLTLNTPGGNELTPDRNNVYTLPETGLYTLNVVLYHESQPYQKCDEFGFCDSNYSEDIYHTAQIQLNLVKGETAASGSQPQPVAFDVANIQPLPPDTFVYSASFTTGGLFTGTTTSPYKLFKLAISEGKPIQITDGDANDIEPDVSADGKLIVFTSDIVPNSDGDEELYVISAEGGKPVRLTNNRVTDMRPVWSPDNSQIAYISDVNNVGIFDVMVMNADGSNVRQLTNGEGDNRTPGWSPDGQKITFSSDRTGDLEIYIMDADGSHVTQLTNSPGNDGRPAFSPDGTKIAFNSDRNGFSEIWMMNVDGSDERMVVTTNPQYATTFWARWSPDGQHLIFHVDSSFLGVVAIGSATLDGKSYAPVANLYQSRGDVNIYGMDWVGDPDAPVEASVVPEQITINAPALTPLNVVAPPGGLNGTGNVLEFTPDNAVIAVGGSVVGKSIIQLIDTKSGKELSHYETPMSTFSPDGRLVAVAACDKVSEYNECLAPAVHIINVKSTKQVMSLGGLEFGNDINRIAFSRDGGMVAIGICIMNRRTCVSDEIRLWDVKTGKQLAVLPGIKGDFTSVGNMIFSPDGTRLLVLHSAAQGQASTQMWDVTNRKALYLLEDDNFTISSDWRHLAAFTCAASYSDCTLHLIDPETGKEQAVVASAFKSYPHMSFSEDGKLLAVADWEGGVVELWDTESVKQVGSLQTGMVDMLQAMSFSSKGSILVVAGCAHKIMSECADGEAGAELWDTADGKPLGILRGHARTVWAAAFSPDGKRLATFGFDEMLIWDVPTVK